MATVIKLSGVPTEAQISAIPVAAQGQYQLTEKEVATTRRFLYSINKDRIRRYRTAYEGGILYVVRWK